MKGNPLDVKVCPKCKERKCLSMFYKNKKDHQGCQCYCKECSKKKSKDDYQGNEEHRNKVRARQRVRYASSESIRKKARESSAKWKKDNPERYKATLRKCGLKRQYGLTVEDLDQMREEQGGLCAVVGCDREANAIDHCHTTGKVRGLLCNQCNTALGLLGEDPGRVVGLLRYIRRHS